MTVLDRELDEFAAVINALSRQSQVALFWVASTVHSESASWRSAEHGEMRTLLMEAQDAAYAFCLGGSPVDRAGALLDRLDRPLPENVIAQSSWICADVSLRIMADITFESGMSIEYALEPVIGRASEELFGFWQVGSGEVEDAQVAEIMAHPHVVSAVEFCRWAVGELAASGAPSSAKLADIRARAAVLTDRRSSS